jgi:hypothetical protein
MRNEIQLKRMYNKFNQAYFDGKLPSDTSIYYDSVPCGYGDCDFVDGVFRIRIGPGVSGWTEVLKLTVLHEMIHVKIWPTKRHGIKFDKEVQRLMSFRELRKLI